MTVSRLAPQGRRGVARGGAADGGGTRGGQWDYQRRPGWGAGVHAPMPPRDEQRFRTQFAEALRPPPRDARPVRRPPRSACRAPDECSPLPAERPPRPRPAINLNPLSASRAPNVSPLSLVPKRPCFPENQAVGAPARIWHREKNTLQNEPDCRRCFTKQSCAEGRHRAKASPPFPPAPFAGHPYTSFMRVSMYWMKGRVLNAFPVTSLTSSAAR